MSAEFLVYSLDYQYFKFKAIAVRRFLFCSKEFLFIVFWGVGATLRLPF
jgi:hypothetical protein